MKADFDGPAPKGTSKARPMHELHRVRGVDLRVYHFDVEWRKQPRCMHTALELLMTYGI